MAILIGLALAFSTGDILYGILSGLAWGMFANSLIGILFALTLIGGLSVIFGVSPYEITQCGTSATTHFSGLIKDCRRVLRMTNADFSQVDQTLDYEEIKTLWLEALNGCAKENSTILKKHPWAASKWDEIQKEIEETPDDVVIELSAD